ncbi:alpha-actinin [Mucor velutinosus]|uniref:Alpha-actinin n=1 Tax=Mucor velutinosus TaxID=708070 RepID=A0AAN7DAR9_9FUNG|nr:alpha-actinin [Mucor velutinosus]
MNIATPVAPAPTATSTSSTANMVVEPSTNAINPPAFLEGMHPPKPDEIHQSPLMPTWIQEIYSRLASVSTHLQTHDPQLEQNQTLIKQTQELIKKNQGLPFALDKAHHHEIAQLKSAAANHTSTPPSATTPVLERSSEGTSASQWADMATKPPADESSPDGTKRKESKPKASTSTKPAPKAKAKRPLTLEQVSRFYSLPSTTHGYQSLYFTSRGREAISKVCAGFQVLGLSQSRILDIHYPTNHIISFLVHNDYASTVVQAMAQLPDSQRITDFDPCAPTILGDPKYANHADPLFLQSEAARIHQERLLRMIKRLNTPNIKLAVARDFCFKRKWISETTYQTLYREIYRAKASKTASSSSTDDVNMDDISASQDSTFQPVASSSSIGPADGVSALLV